MEFKLDQQQETEIKTYVLNVVRDAIKQATTSSKPYLNRKEIAKYFEVVFNTDLGDVYRSYLEIKNRNARTKFLSGLQNLLNDKMNESDA